MTTGVKKEFSENLLIWHEGHHRPMPWKDTKDPYKIWLSEIILQQTRVAQGLPYYEKFVTLFPTVNDLADAPIDQVLKAWEGLGYYSRARNLHEAARYIAECMAGQFPQTYDDILSLKGVGPYTAAAIASFAFDLPYAVLDGNVFRVLARYFTIYEAIDSTSGKKLFQKLSDELLDQRRPAEWNQAIMNLGATICLPQNPSCHSCPLSAGCSAFHEDRAMEFPVKAKRMIRSLRYFHYLWLKDKEGSVLIQKREDKDIWKGLYQFPMLEAPVETVQKEAFYEILPKISEPEWLHTDKQLLTHQEIQARFYSASTVAPMNLPESFKWVPLSDLSNYAFPKIVAKFIQQYL